MSAEVQARRASIRSRPGGFLYGVRMPAPWHRLPSPVQPLPRLPPPLLKALQHDRETTASPCRSKPPSLLDSYAPSDVLSPIMLVPWGVVVGPLGGDTGGVEGLAVMYRTRARVTHVDHPPGQRGDRRDQAVDQDRLAAPSVAGPSRTQDRDEGDAGRSQAGVTCPHRPCPAGTAPATRVRPAPHHPLTRRGSVRSEPMTARPEGPRPCRPQTAGADPS